MILQNIDLNKFKALYWLYHEQSLLKSSTRLNVTPSGVRQSIKALEKSLGIQLFVVSGKSYRPTKEAKEFLGLISPFFDSLEEKLENVGNQRKQLMGDLVIGAPFVYSYELLTGLSHVFNQKHPNVNIQIVSSGTSFLIEKVLQNDFDFAVSYDSPEVVNNSKLIVSRVSEDYLVLCYSPKAFKLKKGTISFQNLGQYKHIAYTPDKLMLRRWYKYHFSRLPNLEIGLTVNNVPSVREAALSGVGFGVLPYSYIEKDLKSNKLKIVETKKNKLTNNRVVIQNADKVPSLLEKTFIKFLTSKN